MDWGIGIDGIEEMIADLRRAGPDGEDELERAIKEATADAHRILSQATPVGATGDARRQWTMHFPEKLIGEVTTNSKVLWFLEWGTGLFTEAEDGKRAKYKIAPKHKKALAFGGNGGSAYQERDAQGQGMVDGKGRALYRSKAGGQTINKRNAASLVVRNYVMHPGIKPVAMVRGNLTRLQAVFGDRVQQAADRLIARLSGGS